MTINEIRKEITNNLNEILLPDGFQLKKKDSSYCYEKFTDFGFNEVWLIFNKYPPIYFVSICKSIRISEINEHYNQFTSVNPDYYDNTDTIRTVLTEYGYPDDRIQIENNDDLAGAIEIMRKFLLIDSIDFFKVFNDAKSVDSELNKENRKKNLYLSEIGDRAMIGLIAAKLTKNPKYEYWEQYYSKIHERTEINGWIKTQFLKTKEYLKNVRTPNIV
jgi:hypothetical protein